MKKNFAILMAVMFLFCGCSMQEIKDEVKDEVKDVKEDFQETKEEISSAMDTSNNKPDKSQFIGEEKAKEIALQKAGITGEGIVFDRVELDDEKGKWVYEIEFKKDKTEYDADISAIDGEIVSWSVENK